ncbi:hypothetical protein [Streptomyces sp. URMC 123]|uniref:hypothetical protein n=1 Tax=Streptomyces sp. URMC 123 TaxID=3423403 RepID=UPI003F1BFBA0
MAQTFGLVQLLSVHSTGACVMIGPRPDNAEMLSVQHDGTPAGAADAGSLIETLATALSNYRPVSAVHADDDPFITGVVIESV